MEPIVEVNGVSKKFCREHKRSVRYAFLDFFKILILKSLTPSLRKGEFWAVQNVSFSLFPGEAIGIIGINGSGKTTLLRMISGLIRPDQGEIVVRGVVSSLFAKGAGFDPILSGDENIRLMLSLLGVDVSSWAQVTQKIIDFSELSREQLSAPVKTYSSGMLARLGFSCVVHSSPNLLIIDEALAVGDMPFRLKCYRKLNELKKNGTAFVMVSHSPNSILQICDKVLYLKQGQLVFEGLPSEGLRLYDLDEQSKSALQNDKNATSILATNNSIIIKDFCIGEISSDKRYAIGLGEKLLLKIKINSMVEVKDLKINLIIRSSREPENNFLHIVNDVGLCKPQSYQIDLDLNPLSLRPGEYMLKFFLTSQNTLDVLCVLENILLEVVGDSFFRGSFFQNSVATLKPLE